MYNPALYDTIHNMNKANLQNILIVHNYYQMPGGEDTVVSNEKEMLEKHGHVVVLYRRDNSEINEMNAMQKLFLPIHTIFSLKTYREIKHIIREEKIDIVHVHNTLTLISPAVYYAARACGVRVVQTIHNFRLLCPGATLYRDGHICEECIQKGLSCAVKHSCYRGSRLQTLACVMSTKIHRMTGIYGKIDYICLTEFNQEKLLTLPQIQRNRVYVKPNYVKRTGCIVPSEQRENQYIFAGRLDSLKGVDRLLHAWAIMGEGAPMLLICGKGPLEEWCRDFIKKNELKTVKMLGYVSKEEVYGAISKSKALILPTQWYEGFPMSIAEAFSMGTPVITSDIGNAADLVIEGINGAKFRADSPEELVKALNRFNEYKDIYNTTIAEYEDNYTEEQNYEKLIEIYKKAESKRER